MFRLPFSPAPRELEFRSMAIDSDGVTIHMSTRRHSVPCPICGKYSERVHSRYVRTLADLPWHDTAVRISLGTRRFFCDEVSCRRRIFTERLPETTMAYACRTLRLSQALQILALALGGEAGSRVAMTLSMGTSPDTLLRRIRALPPPTDLSSPRVLGVDDWAWKKGHTYGTIMVDLERGRVVDLLPDRSADSVAEWLRAHPGAEIISRDRASLYAEGARQGAPRAVQVADRWHLYRNLTDAVERALLASSSILKKAAENMAPIESDPKAIPDPDTPLDLAVRPPIQAERIKILNRERRLARYNEVTELRRRGVPKRTIAKQTGLSRQTVTPLAVCRHISRAPGAPTGARQAEPVPGPHR